MCIRDSSIAGTADAGGIIDASYIDTSSFINAYQFPYKANDCLLYTSDAADDLLCVDLGGRRIIKKKTR